MNEMSGIAAGYIYHLTITAQNLLEGSGNETLLLWKLLIKVTSPLGKSKMTDTEVMIDWLILLEWQ